MAHPEIIAKLINPLKSVKITQYVQEYLKFDEKYLLFMLGFWRTLVKHYYFRMHLLKDFNFHSLTMHLPLILHCKKECEQPVRSI